MIIWGLAIWLVGVFLGTVLLRVWDLEDDRHPLPWPDDTGLDVLLVLLWPFTLLVALTMAPTRWAMLLWESATNRVAEGLYRLRRRRARPPETTGTSSR